jgi:hypothetical protein
MDGSASRPAPGLGGARAIPEPTPRAPGAPSLAAIQTTHEAYRAKKTQIQIGQLEGTLINAREAELAWAGMVTATRNEFLAMPDNASMKFGEEVGAWIRVEINRALTNLSRYTPGESQQPAGGSE